MSLPRCREKGSDVGHLTLIVRYPRTRRVGITSDHSLPSGRILARQPGGHSMSFFGVHERATRKNRPVMSVLSRFEGFRVVLSLLFVLQFVPIEHLPCLFSHTDMHGMMCHREATHGVHIKPGASSERNTCCDDSGASLAAATLRDFRAPDPPSTDIVASARVSSTGISGTRSALSISILSPPPRRTFNRSLAFSSLLI